MDSGEHASHRSACEFDRGDVDGDDVARLFDHGDLLRTEGSARSGRHRQEPPIAAAQFECVAGELAHLLMCDVDDGSAGFVEAIGALYAADVLRSDTLETDALSRRAAALASGTWRERAMIDTLIADTAHDWRIDRLNAVDRNILRLGVYELRHTDLATGIIVDQAVEIAKRFSTARSAAFVNGVLDAIAAERHPTRRS